MWRSPAGCCLPTRTREPCLSSFSPANKAGERNQKLPVLLPGAVKKPSEISQCSEKASTWGNLLLLRRFVKPRSLKLPLAWVMIFVADRHFMPTSTYHVETTIEHSVFIVKALEDTFTKEKALLLEAFSGHCETSQRSKVQLCFVPAESW